MQDFILGYPKNKAQVYSNITLFSNKQDAGNACSNFVDITAKDLTEAKDKFTLLAARNFEPQTNG